MYIDSSSKYKSRIKYVFDLFFSIFGLNCNYLESLKKGESAFEEDDLFIAYDKPENLPSLKIFCEGKVDLFFLVDLFSQVFEIGSNPSLKQLKKKDSDFTIPVIFAYPASGESEIYSMETEDGENFSGITWKEEKGIIEAVFFVDIFASSFYFISLQEEIHSGKKDKHKRFKAEFSFRGDKNLIDYPIVNCYFKLFYDLIRKRYSNRNLPLLRKSFWPNGSSLAVVLTHDVDILEKWFLYSLYRAFQLLLRGKIGFFFLLLKNIFKSILAGENPAYSFELIKNMERQFDFDSTFFFLAGKPSLKSFLNTDITYDITNPRIKTVVEDFESNSGEVGLHGSYHSAFDQGKMQEEKKLLESICGDSLKGIRQHFLRFDLPNTWYIQKKLNFSYDCSLGYPDASGFRSGLAFPFYPYDDSRDKLIEILELNTNIMDQTYVKYQDKSLQNMEKNILKILDTTEDCGGHVTLIWHTNVLDQFGFFGFMDVYQRILEYIHRKRFFVGSGEAIAGWWIKRGNLILRSSFCSGDKNFFWEYVSKSHIEKIILELNYTSMDHYRIRGEGVEFKIEKRKDSVLIQLYDLKPEQSFKIFLQKKDG